MKQKDAGDMNRLDRLGRFLFGSLWIFFAVKCFGTGLFEPVFVWMPVILGAYAMVTGFKGVCPVYRALNTYS